MSLRKFMHPRNKYKKIPDFKELALLYPEFRDIANIVRYIFICSYHIFLKSINKLLIGFNRKDKD